MAPPPDEDEPDAGPMFPDANYGLPEADGAICAETEVHIEQHIPTIILLVDRSISMSLGFPGASSRWNAIYSTLMGTSGVVRELEGQVRFGLSLYTSFNGYAGGTCPVLNEVAPALNNYAQMNAIFAPIGLGEDTPTAASVQMVIPALRAITEPGPKIIVLATDGMPDTCHDPDPDGQQGAKDASVHAVQTAYGYGIETYVISVGPDVTLDHLQELANAGRGMPPSGSGGNVPYYRALDAGSLSTAFESILDDVRTCTFTLDGMVDDDAIDDGHVYLDSVEVPPDQWTLPDPTTLELTGAACDLLLAGGTHDVSATFPCDGIVID